ncbi:MAG: methionyl-tRNA formyltransferase [Phycisphaerae bacterium]|nr:MAG: methionyl-tRNA formyltransferase [Phycisphaerae bacterium]
MRIVFFGSGAFGIPTLTALAKSHDVVGIVTQPDKPAGRGGSMTPTPVAEWASTNSPAVRLIKTPACNAPGDMAAIRALGDQGPLAWVVIAFGQKLSPWLLEGRFAVNLHASLLPRWRGAAPINWAILEGDAEAGNSVITLADRMDAGMILTQHARMIGPATTAGDLHDALATDGPGLIEGVLAAHQAGTLTPRVQDESAVTLAPKLGKADGWVDFARGADTCRRRINGLSPWPGVVVRFRGEALRVLRAESMTQAGPPEAEGGPPPGTILDADEGFVLCGQGSVLRLHEVQAAGKRAMPWRDFANGQRVKAEEVFEGGRGAC